MTTNNQHALIKYTELDVFLDIHNDHSIQFRVVYLAQIGPHEIVTIMYAPSAKVLSMLPGVTSDTHIQICHERTPGVMSPVATVRLTENMHL